MKCQKHGTVMPMVCGEPVCGMCFDDRMVAEGAQRVMPRFEDVPEGMGIMDACPKPPKWVGQA